MFIVSMFPGPIHEIPYRTAIGGGRSTTASLPVLLARVTDMPWQLDGLVATGDLQGIESGTGRLLGHRVAEEVAALAAKGEIPQAKNLGVLLAGDLYAAPERRGGGGDVRDVWRSFRNRFRWVVGVAGNHDEFGDGLRGDGMHLLDGEIVELDGLNIGGVGGIVGRATKPLRRSEDDFAKLVTELACRRPDILLMHDGPDGGAGCPGNAAIRRALEEAPPTLVVRGHAEWESPQAWLEDRRQVLNVEAKVVVCVRA